MTPATMSSIFKLPKDELVLLGCFIGLFVLRQIVQLAIDQFWSRKRPESNPVLRKAYELARPMIPDPNEIKDLSKTTGKTIEELNAWFRTARAQDRSALVCTRLGEAIWRFTILSLNVALVFVPSEFGAITRLQGRSVRSCLHMQLVVLHLLSVRSMPISEFLNVLIEMLARLALVAFCPVEVSELVTVTHDSVDALLELSKIFDLFGFANLAKLTFLVFGAAWTILRFYVFPATLYSLGILNVTKTPARGQSLPMFSSLFVQGSFDLRGYATVLSVAKSAFWTTSLPSRRANRGDSLSSATSLDYESDSSVSSNLRGEYFKDE